MRTIYKKISAFLLSLIVSTTALPHINAVNYDSQVNITVDAYGKKRLISQHIYGIDEQITNQDIKPMAIKQGGSRFSTYNWEKNFSNWGTEHFQTSDSSLADGTNSRLPAAAVNRLINRAQISGVPFVSTTVPIGGFVAADELGPVLAEEKAPSDRWAKNRLSGFAGTLEETELFDNSVFLDEYIRHIVTNYGNAQNSRLKLYFLDNEPDKWNEIHPSAFPQPTPTEKPVQAGIAAAQIIKENNPGALVAGGSFSSIEGCVNLNGAEDWSNYSSEYNWYIDYYLDQMNKASTETRLLDVLDIHYYSGHQANNKHKNIVECIDKDEECRNARMQAPRALWDSSFRENSKNSAKYKQYFPVIPTLQASINTYYPGTKLSFSEYNFGGGNDISGGIAQADALGIFARENIYMAALTTDAEEIDYQVAGMNLYTNYDGNGSAFGNTYIPSTISDSTNSSVYSSLKDGNDSVMKIVLINKSINETTQYNFNIEGQKQYTTAEVYGFDETSSEITKREGIEGIEANLFSYTLKPMTAVMIVLNSTDIIGEISTAESENISYDTLITTEETEKNSETEVIPDSTTNTVISHSTVSMSVNKDLTSTEITKSPHMDNLVVPTFLKVIILVILGLVAIGIIFLFIDDMRTKHKR